MIYLSTGYIDKYERIAFPTYMFDIVKYPIYFDLSNAMQLIDCTEDVGWVDYNWKQIQSVDILPKVDVIYNHFKTFSNPDDYTITPAIQNDYNELYDTLMDFIWDIQKKNAQFIGRAAAITDVHRLVPLAEIVIVRKNGYVATAFLNEFLRSTDSAIELLQSNFLSNFYNFYSNNTSRYATTYLRQTTNENELKIYPRVVSLELDSTSSPRFSIMLDSTVVDTSFAYRLPYAETATIWFVNGTWLCHLDATGDSTIWDGTFYTVTHDYTFSLMDFTSEDHLRRFTNGSSYVDFTEFGVSEILFKIQSLKPLDLMTLGTDTHFSNYVSFKSLCDFFSSYTDTTYASYSDLCSDFTTTSLIKYDGKYIPSHNSNIDIQQNQSLLRNYKIDIPSGTTVDKTSLVSDGTISITFVFGDSTSYSVAFLNTYRSLLHILHDGSFDNEVLVLRVLDYTNVSANVLKINYKIVQLNDSWKLGIPDTYEFPIGSQMIWYKHSLFGILNVFNIKDAKLSKRTINLMQQGYEFTNV